MTDSKLASLTYSPTTMIYTVWQRGTTIVLKDHLKSLGEAADWCLANGWELQSPVPIEITPESKVDSTIYHITVTADQRHELLKLAAKDSALFKTIYDAKTALSAESWTGVLCGGYPLNPRHPNPEKLPDELDIGKRVRFQWHEGHKTVWYTGTITSHYIDGDDCSCSFGETKYGIKRDSASHGHEQYSEPVKYCELIGYPTPVRFPYRWTMNAENPRPDWIGKKVRIASKYAHGPAGHQLVVGQTGTISRISPVNCAWAFWVTPTGGGQDFSANPTDCEFIDFL